MGHGGTLDPMATGILIIGVGNGTKELQGFLECTKSYETVVLFGASTDSYDVKGKVMAKAAYSHVTKEKVEEALAQFRGKIMQIPPIFSALRVNGKKMYEYAREGKDIPELEGRPVEVEELELVEWLEGGSHDYTWPVNEAAEEEKTAAEKLLYMSTESSSRKRKRNGNSEEQEAGDTQLELKGKKAKVDTKEETVESPVIVTEPAEGSDLMSGAIKPAAEVALSPEIGTQAAEQAERPPAARLRMTVTSGFYVRSLCHDLGKAVGSLGTMAALARTRQGYFELGKNALEYDDLEKGEDVWGPKVKSFLETWLEKHGGARQLQTEARTPFDPQLRSEKKERFSRKGWQKKDRRDRSKERRNSSSPVTEHAQAR
jgi:tRNA pseudouridine55 synthase